MDEEEVRAKAGKSIEGGGFVSGLAERIGSAAGASAVFGDPVERDGVTVIPVAKASWGFGGGGGGEGEDEGHGGGGGAKVSPLGYIEIAGGETRYRPFRRPLRTALSLLAAVAGLAGLATLTAVAGLLLQRSGR